MKTILCKGNSEKGNMILITKKFTFRFAEFEHLYYLLEENVQLLKETLSLIAYGEDTENVIPDEEFFESEWNLTNNEVDLDTFLDKTSKYKGKYRIFEFRNDNELLFISEDVSQKTLKEREDSFYYAYNTHVDPTEIYVYKNDDKEKLELLKRLLEKDVNTTIIKCALVSDEYQRRNEKMYETFDLKQGKKIRTINAPKKDVKDALRSLLVVLNTSFESRSISTNQFAYRPNKSIKDNVKIHKNNKYVMKTDITAFFDHCDSDLVFKYIYPIMFDERYKNKKYKRNSTRHDNLFNELKELLYPMLIDEKTNGLYMGSPVSGVLSNMIIKPAVLYIQNILEPKGYTVSVYADDITVSSPEPFNPKYIKKTIEYVFDYYRLPFELKEEKTRYLVNNGRRITGLRINHEDKLTIDRREYKLMRTMLDHLSKGQSITMNLQTLEGRLNFYIWADETHKFRKLAKKYIEVLTKNNIFVNIRGQMEFDI